MSKVTISEAIRYIGCDDHDIDLFESQYEVPNGVSYNSYLIVDDKIAIMDTADQRVSSQWFANLEEQLQGRTPDYLVVSHMEPDHAGSIRLLRQQYPDVQIVGNKQTFGMLNGYHGISTGLYEVKEGDTLSVGRHQLSFYMAPMVHWPEVMVTYDSTDKILFSADAFGTYGTLDGGVIDSEMNVEHYWEEMLRYYSNIVGKYGNPVQRALQKLSALDIRTICSTHGPVWREYAAKAIDIYDRMSRYEGEEGVTIVYGSMYGNTEQMAQAIADAAGAELFAVSDFSGSIADYDRIAFGCSAMGDEVLEEDEFEPFFASIEGDLSGKTIALFGSYGWGDGEWMRSWEKDCDDSGLRLVCESVTCCETPDDAALDACRALGKELAK